MSSPPKTRRGAFKHPKHSVSFLQVKVVDSHSLPFTPQSSIIKVCLFGREPDKYRAAYTTKPLLTCGLLTLALNYDYVEHG